MAKPPRSEPLKPLSEPLIRPIGVRAPATMTVGSVDIGKPSRSGSVIALDSSHGGASCHPRVAVTLTTRGSRETHPLLGWDP